MEMTRRLWRDCHPVMHWEPSLAFCGAIQMRGWPLAVWGQGHRKGRGPGLGRELSSPCFCWASFSQAQQQAKGPVLCVPRRIWNIILETQTDTHISESRSTLCASVSPGAQWEQQQPPHWLIGRIKGVNPCTEVSPDPWMGPRHV